MPISERTALAAALISRSGWAVEIGVPSMTMRPSLGSSSSAKQRSSVVLPEPEGPTTQTTSRSITGNDTRVSTWFVPNRLVTPSARMIGVALMGVIGLMSVHKQFLCLCQ